MRFKEFFRPGRNTIPSQTDAPQSSQSPSDGDMLPYDKVEVPNDMRARVMAAIGERNKNNERVNLIDLSTIIGDSTNTGTIALIGLLKQMTEENIIFFQNGSYNLTKN